ncbi:MAG: SDR family NAD(P)-dependent oxidoreductase, partial [Sulfolobaceae archaeon]
MKIDINGKRVLITASTQGIGFGIAKALAKEGCKLVITSRDERRVKEAVTRLRLFNPEVFGTTS